MSKSKKTKLKIIGTTISAKVIKPTSKMTVTKIEKVVVREESKKEESNNSEGKNENKEN